MGKVSKALNKSQPGFATVSPLVDNASRTMDHEDHAAIHENRESSFRDENKNSAFRVRAMPLPRAVEGNISNWDERLSHSTRYVTGIAEGMRKLRTTILHSQNQGSIRSLLVLSSDPQEGKSFICANLGISFARSLEHQALLVDCDLRRPSLHKLFGLSPRKGLADYLASDAHISTISSLPMNSGMPKLSVIPAGSHPDNPSELLSSEKMAELVDELTSRYHDHIILLDPPPFHATAEAFHLAKLVDKVVLVVRWGKSGRENVKKMIDTIGRDKIIGTVFNAFETNILDKKIQGMGYQNYYAEYY